MGSIPITRSNSLPGCDHVSQPWSECLAHSLPASLRASRLIRIVGPTGQRCDRENVVLSFRLVGSGRKCRTATTTINAGNYSDVTVTSLPDPRCRLVRCPQSCGSAGRRCRRHRALQCRPSSRREQQLRLPDGLRRVEDGPERRPAPGLQALCCRQVAGQGYAAGRPRQPGWHRPGEKEGRRAGRRPAGRCGGHEPERQEGHAAAAGR